MTVLIKNPTIAGGSRDVANGIIEEYKSSGNDIDADTFVHFVNNSLTHGTDEELGSSGVTVQPCNSVKLSATKVLVMMADKASSSARLYAFVVTISGTTITAGTAVTVQTGTYYGGAHSVLVATNRVLTVCATSNTVAKLLILNISGDTITVTDPEMSFSGTISGSTMTATAIGDNKVFITSEDAYIVYSVTASAATLEAFGNLVSDFSTHASATLVGSSIFFMYQTTSSSNYIIKAVAVKLSDYSVGTAVTIFDSQSTATMSPALTTLDSSRVLVVYGKITSAKYARVCTVSGNTITLGTQTNTGISTSTSANYLVALLDDDVAMLAYGGASYLYGAVLLISGTSIQSATVDTTLDTKSYAGDVQGLLAVDDNKVLAYHAGSTSSSVYGLIVSQDTCISDYFTTADSIDGITVEKCTSTTAGEVWVLNPEDVHAVGEVHI